MHTHTTGSAANEYVLGRTSEEYQRLRRQAQAWEPVTRRILQAGGLQAGMSCLDIGCGPGEVMRLMGEMVGPTGSVTGVDVDGKLGNEALGVLQATMPGNFAFLEQDVETSDLIAGQPFDVTFARIVLIHLRNPLATLRKMYEWTKPGGVLIVQEYDFRTVDIYPRFPTYGEFEKVLYTTFEKGGRDTHIGTKLPVHFVEAGVGQADGVDVATMIEPLPKAFPMFQSVYNNLLPRALQFGITTAAESQAYIAEINQIVSGEEYHTATWPMLVSAWKRKPLAA